VCSSDDPSNAGTPPATAKEVGTGDMTGTCSAYDWDTHHVSSLPCTADAGVIAGIVLMVLIIIGCCVGLAMQPPPGPPDSKPPLIVFSKGCVCVWMCPVVCMLLALLATIIIFSIFPGSCWAHHMFISGQIPGYFTL